MNKKGFLRIVEASVAILIIAGVLLVFTNEQKLNEERIDFTERARNILAEASKDNDIRTAILNNEEDTVEVFVRERIRENSLNYEVRICDDISSACGKSTYVEGSVWSAERTISSDLDLFGPKKVRLFIWERINEA